MNNRLIWMPVALIALLGLFATVLTKSLIWMFGALLVIVMGRGLWVFFGHGNAARLKLSEELKMLIRIGAGLLLAINAVCLYEMQSDRNDKDTFKGAIEHLGSVSESVRSSGIDTLYRLADKPRYKKIAHETLCDYISSKTNEDMYQQKHETEPSAEIRDLLLKLLSSEQKNQVFATEDGPLKVNFRDAYLRGANLRKARLQGADLRGAQLQGADLFEAQLQGAHLRGANLRKARLQGADLRGAQLQGADLFEAQLQGAHLQGANLRGAQLQGANLRGAQLQGANLRGAQLQGANLRGAQLQGADLLDAQLQGADLGRAQLHGTNLLRAQLQGANLVGAQLQGANLTVTQLQGVDLRHAQLQGADSKASSRLCIFGCHAPSFAERIKERVAKETNLDTVIFSGGMKLEQLEEIKHNMDLEATYWDKGSLRRNRKKRLEILLPILKEKHVGKDKITGADKESSQYLKNDQIGSYTAEEAEKWIAEYNKATESYK